MNICFSFQQWWPLIPDAHNEQHRHNPLTASENLEWHTCTVIPHVELTRKKNCQAK